MKNVAIIGAGMAGLEAAELLTGKCEVTVFDKSRGVGGRLSTRYAGDFEFDHGAQFFTARSSAFQDWISALEAEGVVCPWEGRFVSLKDGKIIAQPDREPRYVPVHRTNNLPKHMAAKIEVVTGERIARISFTADRRVELISESGAKFGLFNEVISAIPAPQLTDLLESSGFVSSPSVPSGSASLSGCFALMIGDNALPDPGFDGAEVHGSIISWIAANHRKPGRPRGSSLLVHSVNDWADRMMEADPEVVKAALLTELEALLGPGYRTAEHIALHRWRYAKTAQAAGMPFWRLGELPLVACGDWLQGSRVEDAWLSGRAAAHYVLETLS